MKLRSTLSAGFAFFAILAILVISQTAQISRVSAEEIPSLANLNPKHPRVFMTDAQCAETAALLKTDANLQKLYAIVEKEAANDEERPIIASIIYNRLNQNMMLQMDSTVHYGLSLVGRGEEKLSTDLVQSFDSPYNCYRVPGLPAGPICNPGMASIQAALNPAATNYIYMALDPETDTHKFFIYPDEHAAFVATQDYGQTQ